MSDFSLHDTDSNENVFAAKKSYTNTFITFPVFVMVHLGKINESGMTEWTGGYTKKSEIVLPDGRVLTNESYVPNTRATFCNAVMTMYDILACRLSKDEIPTFDDVIKEIRELTDDDYRTDKSVLIHRKLLQHIHYHLARRSYYSGDDFFQDGKPVDPRSPAQLDENGKIILGRIK